MDQNITSNLVAVINTLNQISVCGKQNLMRMSGCIDALEHILAELDAEPGHHTEVKR